MRIDGGDIKDKLIYPATDRDRRQSFLLLAYKIDNREKCLHLCYSSFKSKKNLLVQENELYKAFGKKQCTKNVVLVYSETDFLAVYQYT